MYILCNVNTKCPLFFPPWVVILVVVQSNVPLRTCFWPLYWTSSLCRCELMSVLLWNFYTGDMFLSKYFWYLLSEPLKKFSWLPNYQVCWFSFTSFCAIIGHIKIEVYSICPLPVLSSHRVDFLETHSNDPNRIWDPVCSKTRIFFEDSTT